MPRVFALTPEQRTLAVHKAVDTTDDLINQTAGHEGKHAADAIHRPKKYMISQLLKTGSGVATGLALFLVGVPAPIAIGAGIGSQIAISRLIYHFDPAEKSADEGKVIIQNSSRRYKLFSFQPKFTGGR